MLTLSAELPMVYMPPATFRGSQTASCWHYQVHCSAWALRRYSHCLCLHLKMAQGCGTIPKLLSGFSWKAGPSVSRFEYMQIWPAWGLNAGEYRAYRRWTTSCLTDCSYKAKSMLEKQAPSSCSKYARLYYRSSKIPSTHLLAYLIYRLCAALK